MQQKKAQANIKQFIKCIEKFKIQLEGVEAYNMKNKVLQCTKKWYNVQIKMFTYIKSSFYFIKT